MKVELVGPAPAYASEAERTVGERLRSTLPPAGALWIGERVSDRRKDHEMDAVVAIPDVGVVCLEVKGGQVTCDAGEWRQHHRDGTSKRINPVEQARKGRYALRDYVERDPRWGSRGKIRWAHAVCFPH